MLSEHVLPSDQQAPEVSEWRAEEHIWMQQAFTTFVISSALIFGCFSFLTNAPTTKMASLGCFCSGFALKYSISWQGKSDQSSAAGWAARAFTSPFLKHSFWRQLLTLSAYWSICWATAELSLQAGTMKHGCYIVLHLITQLCLAPVTNMSPKRFLLVSLVQAHRWHRFHQAVSYNLFPVKVFGSAITIFCFLCFLSADKSRNKLDVAMQQEQETVLELTLLSEAFERMLDCLFDATCWVKLDSSVSNKVSQSFIHFFSNMSGFPLETLGVSVEDKQKIHRLLEDAQAARGKRAAIDSVRVALPGLSCSSTCRAKLFGVLKRSRWNCSHAHSRSQTSVEKEPSELSSAPCSNFGKLVFVGFQLSQIQQAEAKQTSVCHDEHMRFLDVEVTPWDSISQVAARAEMNQRKKAVKRKPRARETEST